MVTVDEMQNFPEFAQLPWELKTQIKQNLIALPQVTAINVNTANEWVLQSLGDWLTPQIAQAWMLQRLQQPAESVDEFVSFLETQTGLSAAEIAQDLPTGFLSVQSEFFLLTGQLSYGLADQMLIHALFYRNAQHDVQLVQRWLDFAE